jgi:hypothetical protein
LILLENTISMKKQGSLFCFVMVIFRPTHSCRALGIFRKLWLSKGASSTWFERLFGATVWKLLIIDPFSQWKINQIKSNLKTKILEIWVCSWCCWKALLWVRFNNNLFHNFQS